jgi:hypothetical protein
MPFHAKPLTAYLSSNNFVSNSLSSESSLTDDEVKALLASPESYLAKLPQDEARRIRNLITPAYRDGFRVIFIITAASATLAFFVALILMPQVELKRPDDEKQKEEARKRIEAQTKVVEV